MAMDGTRLAEFATLLRRRRDDVDAALAALEAELQTLLDARGDTAADDEHDPEGVTLSEEWSRAEGMRSALARERLDVDAALVRCTRGTYGVCVDCGRAIPAGRLRVMPQATRCVDCAQRVAR